MTEKLNLVLIVADDLGYRDLSCYGCKDFQTPNIDSLAKSGVRLTSGYVTHPYCSPSRAGILSGKYQQSFGHEHNPPYDEKSEQIGIDAKTTLLPTVLKNNGYQTALIGKWHLGAGKPFRPSRRGFSQFYGFLGGGHDYFRVDQDYLKKSKNGNSYLSPMWRNQERTKDTLSYLTDDLTREGEKFLEENKNSPFCLVMMYNAPHAPDQVTKEQLKRVANIKDNSRRRYAALVQGLDDGVGKLTKKLKDLELDKNTLVVFLSDNGGRRGVSDNRPLRGNKGWLHEGGVRVPFICSLPGRIKANSVEDRPMLSLDVLPTILGSASADLPEGCVGKDLLPFLTGKNKGNPHETIYWRVSGGVGYAIRNGNWKLVRDIGMKSPKLYNLKMDLGENQDLASAYPEKFSSMLKQYESWNDKQERPRWKEGHTKNTLNERAKANAAGTRQFPMKWTQEE